MTFARTVVLAAVASGAPSTLHTLATGGDVLESTRAAGSLLVGQDRPDPVTLSAGVIAHGALSFAWTATLWPVLARRRHPVVAGALAGLGIAALDLGIVGRRFPAIAALPAGPQVADHVAFGALIGWGRSRA